LIKIYYSNIADEEAKYFHGLTVPNFTIKLSDILHQTSNVYDNKLFKIEEIITDSIYRIYPLFYCETIISTNPLDKIMENRLIIAHKETEKETYITFIGDHTNPDIQDYISYGTYYSIGDSLTTSQFNSIIQLLKQNTVHTDEFRLNDKITGTYGTYEFDLEDVSFLDTGILITSQTISAEPKVRLTAPVFRWSTYTLKLTVFHYTGVNILDDITPSDLKVVETLEIELTEDTWVDIPVETLEQNYIISFDATVDITHDKPEIHIITDIEVSASPEIIQSGNSTDIYGQLIDTDGKPYNIQDASGTTIHFFERLVPSLTLSATKNIIQSGDTTDISCKVIDEDGSIAKNAKVYFYKKIGE